MLRNPPTLNEREARRIVGLRSGGRCELCQSVATDWAHRVNASQGGLWIPSNGLHLCHRCHMWTHNERNAARDGGWIIRSGEHPATVAAWIRPLTLWAAWWLLDDDGCFARAPEQLAPPHRPPWALLVA